MPTPPPAPLPRYSGLSRQRQPSTRLAGYVQPPAKRGVQPKAKMGYAGFLALSKAPRVDPPQDQDPRTYAEAMGRPDAHRWHEAMCEEMGSQRSKKTWTVLPLPPGKRALPVRWIYTRKRNGQGVVVRYKARLVVKGFMQRYGIDYGEVFAPTVRWTTVRLFFSIVAADDLELEQLDVKTAFLHGELEEDIWIAQPPGFEEGGTGLACKLHKAVYGLKQAPRVWHSKLKSVLDKVDYKPSDADPALFINSTPSRSFALTWVDDVLTAHHASTATKNPAIQKLADEFGEVTILDGSFALGLEIQRDRSARTLKLSQRLLTEDLLEEFGMAEAKPRSTPFPPGCHPSKAGADPLPPDSRYAEVVGSLLYLATVTRPDIAQAVGVLTRYMAAPTTEHWQLAMGVLRYLAGTRDWGIVFGPTDPIVGYTDSDYAGDPDIRRSTSGFVFTMNGGSVSWSSRLQPTVAVSTAEAEYMAASPAVKEALWLRKLLADFGKPVDALTIFTDNQAALALLKNPVSSVRTKHIDVIHHFARERVERNEVQFVYIASQDNVADTMTKPLPAVRFRECCADMGMQ